MMRQYGAQRFQPSLPMVPRKRRGGITTWQPQPGDFGYAHRVGTVPIGTIVYLQDGLRPFGRDSHHPIVCRNPWQVVAWRNREYFPAVAGRPRVTYMVGGHLAEVKSLRDGRVKLVADWMLLACLDAGLEGGAA